MIDPSQGIDRVADVALCGRKIAATVANIPGLRFTGLQAYHGRAEHLRLPAERRDAIARTAHARI